MRLTASRVSITSSGGAVLDAIQQEDPTLDLNFEETKTLTDDVSGTNLITFSRASSGTYVGSDGLIKTSAVNLLTYSEQFDQWDAGSNTTITTNAIAAPDGSMTADRAQFPATSSTFVRQQNVISLSTQYTGSVWVKAVTPGTNDQFSFQFGSGSGSSIAFFTATSEWQRVSATVTSVTAGNFIINNSGDTFASDIYIWGAQLEEGTTATDYIPTGATISGAPRFDHDPVTGESLGLLIEEERTNYVSYSNDFTQWVRAGNPAPVLVPASGASPSGLNDATELTYPAISVANSFSIIFVRPGTSNNTEYVFSAYLKGTVGGETVYLMTTPNGSVYTSEEFTLTTSWERYSFTTTTLGSNSFFQIGVDLRDSNQSAQSAQTFSIWGAQLEAGSFPTSYIPTSGSTVTRAADLASIEGTNFSSWFNPSEGTIYSKAIGSPQTTTTTNTGSGYPYIYSIDSSFTNRLIGSRSAGVNNGSWAAYAQPPASFSYVTSSNFNTQQVSHKVGGSYTSSTYVAFADGAVGSSITPGTNNSALLRLSIGSGIDGGFWGGHISRLAYFPTRKTDQELVNMTL